MRMRHLFASTSTRLRGATPITLGDGVLDRLPRLLDEAKAPARRFVVSSPLVWRLHGARLASAHLGEPILVPDGERFKHLPDVARVYDALIRANADRASTLITFGGGVIGDMAGFAAAHVPARHRARARADDAAGPGRQRDRRQGRRQPRARQEPDRRLSSAARRRHRSVASWRRCRAASSAPASTK